MASHIARRKFLATLGGAAAAWPLAAGTQGERVPRIVFLHALAENDPEVQTRVIWTQRNIQVEHRFSAGDFARMQAYTVEVVSSAPDLIVGSSTPVIAALKQATQSIPIVFAVLNDPVGPAHPSSAIPRRLPISS